MDVRELYQQMILDHNRAPRNFGKLEDATHASEGFNPLCGDRYTVYLKLAGDVIEEVRFEGAGCAISKASASLMTEGITGCTTREATNLFEVFQRMVTGEEPEGGAGTRGLGRLAVLSGVRAFPTRVKCASLVWNTMMAALKDGDAVVSTE